MKRTLAGLLVTLAVASVLWAQAPTSNVLYRVLRLRTAAGTGSAFTIEVDGKQYLVTAKHNLKGFGTNGEIELWLEGKWSRVKAQAIYPSKDIVDIAALDVGRPLTVSYPLEPSSAGIVLGQQVYFVGFPYGLSTLDQAPVPKGFGGIPFLKSGIVSAMDSRDQEASVIYLDGHNNPGFSGGPIVFWHSETRQFRVAGVVQGYRNEVLPVVKSQDLGNPHAKAYDDLYAKANSGIVVGYNIRHIVDAIRAASRTGSPQAR